MPSFRGTAAPLSSEGLLSVAETLGVKVPEIWAVLTVETRGCGFLPDRRPLILFERHIFHRETGGVHAASRPDLSSKRPGGYAGGAGEYKRLQQAVKLDRVAALRSTSWGLAQVMGFNFAEAGFSGVENMVALMIESEDHQLSAMGSFLAATGLARPLARHDWATFARGYNGKDFAKNKYDTRLAAALEKFRRGPLPDLEIRQAQVYLMYLGFKPGPVDGVLGRFTRSAIQQFREENGLTAREDVDSKLIESLREAANR